jgi:phosphoribosylaminoimidazole-succinocarboxamide synthase
MDAHLPHGVAQSDLSTALIDGSVLRTHSGKVRDSFTLPGHPDKMLVVATDRISIFDFVLNATVAQKGEVLTAMTVFWLTKVLQRFSHHLVASYSDIDEYLPEALRGNRSLQRRALVVKNLDMLQTELIVRGYLTGSGWRTYQAEKKICGIPLPDGYHDGSRLAQPIFTPTTKATEGHDEDIPADSISSDFRILALSMYSAAAAYALVRGIIIADTKFEVGLNKTVADEVLTPDSSRFWLQEDWIAAAEQRHSPSGFDKEPVRDWGRVVNTTIDDDGKRIIGINKLDPTDPTHLRFVDKLEVPLGVLESTTARYLKIFEMLTGMTLEQFQQAKMAV